MKRYYLGSRSRLCTVGQHVVFLDLLTQQYLGLDCSAMPELQGHLSTAASTPDPGFAIIAGSATDETALDDLLRRRLVSLEPDEQRGQREPIQPPTRSLLSIPRLPLERLPALAIVRVLLSVLNIRLRLRFFGLQSVVNYLRNCRSKVPQLVRPDRAAGCAALVRHFCRIRPWLYTANQQCLLDSFVLTDFLIRSALPAKTVIAIHPMPFSAHAWVQVEDCVIDDPVETTRMYTPILMT